MSDPTRFDLDERQRAMLAEMGVRVWWPTREPTSAHAPLVPALAAPAPVVAAVPVLASVPAPVAFAALVPENTRPAGVSHMPWAQLQTSLQNCRACALCAERQQPVGIAGDPAAPWMVVGDLPSEDDEQAGQAFAGPEGLLLDNMLKAVGVSRQGAAAPQPSQAWLTHAVKCRPPKGRNPEAAELAMCGTYLSRQVELVQPQVILAMGRFAIQSLLGSTEPLGKLRGRVHAYQGVPVVVTYHPANLLRSPADKAKAWADLVLALQVVRG